MNTSLELKEENSTKAVTNSELQNSVSLIEQKSIILSHTPGFWELPKSIAELKELTEQKNSNQIKLHLE